MLGTHRLLGVAVVLASCVFSGCSNLPQETAPDPSTKVVQASADIDADPSFEERWGIEILGIRRSADGLLLDFRYKVIDPVAAQPLFARQVKPVLIHNESGARVRVPSSPKVGPMRSSNRPQKDRTYFVLFANPSRFMKEGTEVTVEIGEFRAENLVVQ